MYLDLYGAVRLIVRIAKVPEPFLSLLHCIFVHGSTAPKATAWLLSWLAQRFAFQLKQLACISTPYIYIYIHKIYFQQVYIYIYIYSWCYIFLRIASVYIHIYIIFLCVATFLQHVCYIVPFLVHFSYSLLHIFIFCYMIARFVVIL